MRKLAVVILFASFAACDLGDDPPTGDEHPDDPPVEVTGTIMADTTWTGAMRFTGLTVVAGGVTVTVEPGTTLEFAQRAGLEVHGALLVNGTAAKPITAKIENGGQYWGPIAVHGLTRLTYVDFDGGQLTTNGPSANLEIVDSKFVKANGDYVIMNGGNLNMQYSQLGPDDGETDSTHCQLHINTATTINVLRSNIAGAPFGIMLYGGIDSSFQLNNWYANDKDVDTASGANGNFSGSWFEAGAPTAGPGASLTLENLAAARIQQAGPRL
jgi:hypothetical protein